MRKKILLFTTCVLLFTFVFNINVFARHEANIDEMSDYFSPNNVCKNNSSECKNEPEYKFYQKMYDLYYLYLTKYNVKLDLPLIMSTLTFNSDDTHTVFQMNLSDYERQIIVESDWNPTDITSLDWNYDYESKENYLVSNDSSMDMQILAKNMVSKTTVEKCVKDGSTTKSQNVKDGEDDLKCDDGETLERGNSTYELDLDKYDDFLLEYIEKKYYLNRVIANPVKSSGPSYNSSKTPSIINKKKNTKKSEESSDKKDGNYVDNVSFMSGSFHNKIYYFNQCEEPYSSHSYGGYGNMCGYGCGPTALSIVISSIYDESHDPIEVTDYLCSNGGCSSDGTYHDSITSTAEHYGLKVNKTGDTQQVISSLASGNSLVIAIMCPGHFTPSGHFITLTGASSDGNVTVADPASRDRSTTWPFNTVVEETCNSNGSPFWIISK